MPSHRGPRTDLTGQRFFHWEVIGPIPAPLDATPSVRTVAHWECLCRCGNVVAISGHHLKSSSRRPPPCRECGASKCLREEWAIVAETGGAYEVSSLGRVSRRRVDNSGRPRRNFITPTRSSRGHLKVAFCVDSVRLQRSLARVVAVAFYGDPGPAFSPSYRDGDRSNCRADNLAWKESIGYRSKTGPRESRSPAAPTQA